MNKKLAHIIQEENFLSLAGNVIIALFGIGSFGILARTLAIEQFGQWVLFISGGALIDMFRFGITNTALVRFLSGAESGERKQLLGSNAFISVLSTGVVALLLFGAQLTFHSGLQKTGYALFFTWYPLLCIINLPWNNALVILQANREYRTMLLIKAVNSVVYFFLLVLNYYLLNLSLTKLVIAYLGVQALTSALCIRLQCDGLRFITQATRQHNKTLFHFGKYTTFTLVATNLLRSADAIIIGLSPLGSTAVALYSIPLKLTELQQIPLRSFAATAFPKMSRASMEGNQAAVKQYFYTYAGAITYLFVFISAFTFVFADVFVLLVAGKKYLGNDPFLNINITHIVRVLSLYGLLLPIDRMTGIGLDSINKPQVNAIKVGCMLLANIAGDLIAVFLFQSLLLVAVSSVVFTVLGIYIGMYFLNRELILAYKNIFIYGIEFYKTQLNGLLYKQAGISKA